MNRTLREAIGKRGPFESLQQEVFLNLQHTADVLMREIEGVLRQTELSATQYNVLRILRGEGGGLACTQIARRMITRDPDITRLLDRLETRQLLARGRDANDRRVITGRITRRGMSLLATLDAPIRAAHRKQFSHMNQRRLRTLLRLLEEVQL